jgi:hypothetical protein
MPLRISFDLVDADLQHLEDVALQTQALARSQPEHVIVAAARTLLDEGLRAQPAQFVKERYSRLRTMLELAEDPDWPLGVEDRQRVINALACFSAPSDPSAAGLLDRAIMIELVSRDLHHDLEAYRDFCKFRETQAKKRSAAPGGDRDRWLQQKRAALQARMHKRRKRELEVAGGSVRRFFSLFGL